jgi:hypothetical protein
VPLMAARIGKCLLCLRENVTLCDGHVVPRWAYERLREERSGENPNPMLISGGKALQTSKQVTEYMFCKPCDELKFGPYDEYVSTLAFNGDVFPAMESLGRLGWAGSLGGAEPGSLDLSRLVYFACSVVWRGHVASSVSGCNLGPLSEAFRAFLNGERPLLSTIQVTLTLLADQPTDKAELRRLIAMPKSQRKRPHFSHEFVLCGMWFAVRTGASKSDIAKTLTSDEALVGIAKWEKFLTWLGPELLTSRYVGKKPPLDSNSVRMKTR